MSTDTDLLLETLAILPTATVAEIAALCDKHGCVARIESIGGKPVAYLVREDVTDIPLFLRRQAS